MNSLCSGEPKVVNWDLLLVYLSANCLLWMGNVCFHRWHIAMWLCIRFQLGYIWIPFSLSLSLSLSLLFSNVSASVTRPSFWWVGHDVLFFITCEASSLTCKLANCHSLPSIHSIVSTTLINNIVFSKPLRGWEYLFAWFIYAIHPFHSIELHVITFIAHSACIAVWTTDGIGE